MRSAGRTSWNVSQSPLPAANPASTLGQAKLPLAVQTSHVNLKFAT